MFATTLWSWRFHLSAGCDAYRARLRDAGKPLWLVVLFFVPVINLLFFLLLCTMDPFGDGAA